MPLMLGAQETGRGVRFESVASWGEAQAKAKHEKKYLLAFVCAPNVGLCALEDSVFGQPRVGEAFNSRFVAVKVLGGSANTAGNGPYLDVPRLHAPPYNTTSFPRFLVFSADGTLLHGAAGGLTEVGALALAHDSQDPSKQYYAQRERYDRGEKDYAAMRYLARKASEMGDVDVAHRVARDYIHHLSANERFAKDNLGFIAAWTERSGDPGFAFFTKQRDSIDRVMERRGFAQGVVDHAIATEEINALAFPNGRASETVPDWAAITRAITRKYGAAAAERTVLDAEIRWSTAHQNWDGVARYSARRLERYGSSLDAFAVNALAWDLFLYSADSAVLALASRAMEAVVRRIEGNPIATEFMGPLGPQGPELIDTYANLLHKMGRTAEAIKWEEKAVKQAEGTSVYQELAGNLAKMKKGQPTWPAPTARPTTPTSIAPEKPRIGINYNLRSTLAKARANGTRSLSVAVMTARVGSRAVDSLVEALRPLGAQVITRFDEIGYLRVQMPTESVLRIGALPGVADFHEYDATMQADYREYESRTVRYRVSPERLADRVTSGAQQGAKAVLTAADLAQSARLVPRDEVGADAFAKAQPLADGRGVTVGLTEFGIDPDHGALQQALTLRGDTIRKIAGVLDGNWLLPSASKGGVHQELRATAKNGVIEFDGNNITMPDSGVWNLGHWVSGGMVAAWRDTTGVWLEANDNPTMRGPIRNANYEPDGGVDDGHNNDGYDGAHVLVAFGPDGRPWLYRPAGHTMMVAATATGSRFLGGGVGGVAPGARVLPVLWGLNLEDMLVAARHPRIDVITHENQHSQFPSDGGSFAARILNRAVQVYGKPIFNSAANGGPALGTVTHLSTPAEVMSVGAYVSMGSYEINESWHVPNQDNLALYSSRGPAPDGALKPDIVAPTQMITATVCGDTMAKPEKRTFRLPACYMVGGGTSNAAPFAAGVAALLLSAARLNGMDPIRYDAESIDWALRASARQLPGIELYEQGAGLIQVDSAWKLLTLGTPHERIVSSGPVKNAYAPFLLNPGRGPGLFLREGWTAGRRGRYAITLTRTTGGVAAKHYRLRWLRNDGTFQLRDSTVTLAKGVGVQVGVDVAPKTPGIHSAAIEVSDAETNLLLVRVPTTVIAGLPLTRANNFEVRYADSIPWPNAKPVFLNVPAGITALRVRIKVKRGATNVMMRGPLQNGGGTFVVPEGPMRDAIVVVEDPHPGTWELTFAPWYEWAEPLANQRVVEYELTASAMLVRGTGGRESVSFENAGAEIQGAVLQGSFARRRTIRGVVTQSAMDTIPPLAPYDVQVELGSTSLRIAFEADSNGSAGRHTDMHVYRCEEPARCDEQATILADDTRQEVRITDPKAGKWKIVVDPARVRKAAMSYTLTILETNPKWGTLQLRDSALAVPRGKKVSVPVHFTCGSATEEDFVGVVDLVAGDGAVFSGTPEAGWIAPQGHRAPIFLGQALIRLPRR